MKNLVITREEPIEEHIKLLANEKGVNIFHLPLIKTKSLEINVEIPSNYDFLIITSKKTLKYFKNLEILDKNKPVLTTGDKTKKFLKSLGFTNIIIPKKQSAEGIKEYIYNNNLQSKKFLFLRAKKGKKIDLPNITVIPVYETITNFPDNKKEFLKLINKDTYILFSSPSTFKGFKENFENYKDLLAKIKVIPIGDTTKTELEKDYIKIFAVPTKPSIEEVIKLL
ncbi:MAG: uroporphyrinogen-III synthase [Hydrogenothermus sp.]|nr:MAG: uroporphyrinogen-III synthase [Hydrogenothermus sp.]